MSILGLTIDYGPYAFMEHFDPKYICNHSDHEGRYRYEAQPEICKWNLEMLAQALNPVVPIAETTIYVENNYWTLYNEAYRSKMSEKLGLVDSDHDASKIEFTDEAKTVLEDLFKLMTICGSDFTNTFRDLSLLSKSADMTDED